MIQPTLTRAQSIIEVENEYNNWISGSFSKKILKDLDLSISPEIRLKDQLQWNKFQSDFEISYQQLKHLETAIGYRLALNNTSSGTEFLNRFYAYLALDKKFDQFTFKLQLKYTNETGFDAGSENDSYLRYKAKHSYNIKKTVFTLYCSAEAFQYLNEREFDLMRYHLGTTIKLNKKSKLDIGYALNYYLKEYKNGHIVKLGYSVKF